MVPLELWGPEGRVDVAYPVVSLGKMIESGFTFSFDDYMCHMHRQQTCRDLSQRLNLRVEFETQVAEEHGLHGCAHRWHC